MMPQYADFMFQIGMLDETQRDFFQGWAMKATSYIQNKQFDAAFAVMHSSTNFQAPPISVVFYCYCDKFYHKQEVCFILYLLGQIVTWH